MSLSRKQKEKLLASLREAEKKQISVPFPGSDIPVAVQYKNNIPAFVEEVLGVTPRPTQRKILADLIEFRRVCIRTARGYGKTALAAWVVLWALAVFPDVKVITTASAWQQLTNGLWPEIARWVQYGNWKKVGIEIRDEKELTSKRLQLSRNRFAYAASSKDAHRIEGTHAEVVVCVIDEAKAVPDEIWDAIEGSFIGSKEYYYVAISTPGVPQGRFYDIHARKAGYEDWKPYHVTYETAIAEGVTNFETLAKQRARQWGKDSPFYRQQFLAEFAQDEETALIPLSWVHKAQQRWYDHEVANMSDLERRKHLSRIGMDVGGEGTSQTVIARLYDETYVALLQKHKNPDTNANVGYLKSTLEEGRDEEGNYIAPANVDAIGIGVGVADLLKDHPAKVNAVNVSKPTKARDRTGTWQFINLRSQLWWRLRERLDPANKDDELLALPPDDDLTGELVSIRYNIVAGGKLQVESKQQVKRRLGHSPDHADAVMLLMYDKLAKGVRLKQYGYNPFYK